jgi:hypothetical protein
MNLNLSELIEQLKLSGVQEVSFTIKFADNNPIPKAVKGAIAKNKATVVEVPKPEIPQEMLAGDL